MTVVLYITNHVSSFHLHVGTLYMCTCMYHKLCKDTHSTNYSCIVPVSSSTWDIHVHTCIYADLFANALYMYVHVYTCIHVHVHCMYSIYIHVQLQFRSNWGL